MVILFVELHISVHFSKCIILHDKKVKRENFKILNLSELNLNFKTFKV